MWSGDHALQQIDRTSVLRPCPSFSPNTFDSRSSPDEYTDVNWNETVAEFSAEKPLETMQSYRFSNDSGNRVKYRFDSIRVIRTDFDFVCHAGTANISPPDQQTFETFVSFYSAAEQLFVSSMKSRLHLRKVAVDVSSTASWAKVYFPDRKLVGTDPRPLVLGKVWKVVACLEIGIGCRDDDPLVYNRREL